MRRSQIERQIGNMAVIEVDDAEAVGEEAGK
jgi:hypothetical protein